MNLKATANAGRLLLLAGIGLVAIAPAFAQNPELQEKLAAVKQNAAENKQRLPAILLAVDGEPTMAEIPKTGMEFVVNTTWPLFFEKSKSTYYLLIGQQWATAGNLNGPWSLTIKLPKDMSKVVEYPQWCALKKVVPPAASNAPLPQVFYSSKPAEIILFDGKPVYSKIPGTQLVYSTNTASYLFLHTGTNQYFYLTGGRWFRANSLLGPLMDTSSKREVFGMRKGKVKCISLNSLTIQRQQKNSQIHSLSSVGSRVNDFPTQPLSGVIVKSDSPL